MLKFHYSIDDVHLALHDLLSSNINNNFLLKDLRSLYLSHNLKTSLYLFQNFFYKNKTFNLNDLHGFELDLNLKDDWLFFGPHAWNFESPPYESSKDENIYSFNKIYEFIESNLKNKTAASVRLHYYSECFNLKQYFFDKNVNELFITDKQNYSHTLSKEYIEEIKKNGYCFVDGLRMTRTHFRVEDIANKRLTKDQIISNFEKIYKKIDRIIIYSHEYEHRRPEVIDYLYLCIDILTNYFEAKSE